MALVILAIAATRLPESRDRQAHRLDWPGALLITASLTGITYGLLESPTRGFGDPAVLAALLLGTGLLVAFIVVRGADAERRWCRSTCSDRQPSRARTS